MNPQDRHHTVSHFSKYISTLKAHLSTQLGRTAQQILITNISEIRQSRQSYYCLIFEPDSITYANREGLNKTHIQFDLAQHQLSHNGQLIPIDRYPMLHQHIKSVIRDYQQCAARLYEKR